MLVDTLIGAVLLGIGLYMALFHITVLLLLLSLVLFILLSFMVGSVVRECFSGYKT